MSNATWTTKVSNVGDQQVANDEGFLARDTLQNFYFIAGNSHWTMRGLLDFNLQFRRFPAALPDHEGSFPPGADMR